MTTRSLPEIRQTLPGRSRPYRLYTVDHVDFDTFYGLHSLVTCDRWGVSYQQEMDENWNRTGMIELRVYDVRSTPGETEKHALYGTTYLSEIAARRAAFEAGVLAFMVYLDKEQA